MNENPYKSPEWSQAGPAEPHWLIGNAARVIVASVVSTMAGFFTWVVLILALFANSTAYWPGWACGVPAVVVTGAVFWRIVRTAKSVEPVKEAGEGGFH